MTRRLWAVEKCIEEGCNKPPLARSLCSAHYQRRRTRGEELPPKVRYPLVGVECAVGGCNGRATAQLMCPGHAARRRRYGLRADELAHIDAHGICEVCGTRADLHVDHDHSSGVVRGLLCRGCNTALGLVGERVEVLLALTAYLYKHSNRPEGV